MDRILKQMDQPFDAVYSREGCPSIPPEWLLRASLLQVLFTIRSERQLVAHIEHNLWYQLVCWAGYFLTGVKHLTEWAELSNDKHLSTREPQWGKTAATMWMSTSKQCDRWA
ncbi:transposase [Nitrosomonas sp. Nm58]|uniref:transposase n=1 Tax=Nitrosomonas sp. Nm58 TaxID=200126 RepID=UPI0015A53C18|nr:transposase [Nitrosomonas sp. Nm58]